jgi:gamma-glutamylcyclotransferase (GGCT)/AIG2-like uncharacterized protein YtfP
MSFVFRAGPVPDGTRAAWLPGQRPGDALAGYLADGGDATDALALTDDGEEHRVLAAAGELAPLPDLFVYGTLLMGEVRSQIMTSRGELVGPATAAGVLYDLGAYPGLRPGAGQVHGEVYRLADPATALEALDLVEGFYGFGVAGSLYRRAIVRATVADAAHVAWVYVLAEEPAAPRIANGDWRRRM